MTMRDSGWKYYLPENGGTSDDATMLRLAEWQRIFDAESAAVHAAEAEWDDGGWESRDAQIINLTEFRFDRGNMPWYKSLVLRPEGV